MEESITSEGLFRVPPHAKLRDVLKEAYDRGQKYIVWKDNGVTLSVPPYTGAEHQEDILAEVDPKDAYSVFMAAALIKAWYASLRQPIFPTSSYADLRRLYGDPQDVPDLHRLTDLLSPDSEWSLLPGTSREIIVRHLLPLLAAVSARHESNKMTAENLAVCFAPALLCGPDQIEDAKMSSIIRRIITHAAEMWPHGLREACGQSPDAFHQELVLPKDELDWEDPVEEKRKSGDDSASLEDQVSGITMEDNEKSFEGVASPYPVVSHDYMPPPLPPRSRVPSTKLSADSTKRKPAPPLQVPPPRYSTAISDAPGDVAESPVTYSATTDGFSPRRSEDQPPPLPPRWDQVSSEKTGTRDSTSVPAFAAKINLPKRKTLTSAQVDNVERSGPAPVPVSKPAWMNNGESASQSQGVTQPPQILTTLSTGDQAPAPKRAPPPVPPPFTPSRRASPGTTASPTSDSEPKPASNFKFRRPSIPASANRVPTITGLARPVYPNTPPVHPITNRPASKSTSLPVPSPKPRTVSPGLLHRMPSFEARAQPVIERKMLTPNKLNLRKQSVEDLRKLYEERAGTANALVEAAKWRSS